MDVRGKGGWVGAGSLEARRSSSAVGVEMTFSDQPPSLSQVAGVKDVEVEGARVRCHVTGPIQPLLEAVRGHNVVEMFSHEPSLEELFLAHYGST